MTVQRLRNICVFELLKLNISEALYGHTKPCANSIQKHSIRLGVGVQNRVRCASRKNYPMETT